MLGSPPNLVIVYTALKPVIDEHQQQLSSPLVRYSSGKRSDRDVNWMSPVQGKSPPVQVKEPYGNLDMVT